MKLLVTKEVLTNLQADLDKNLEIIHELKNQIIKSQRFDQAANLRDIEKGIEIMKKHIQKYLDKLE